MALAREDFQFLSQARCRHFLAAIAPRLLEAISRTPDPDMTLTNLEKVSASLGAKAILWELFNFNPPSLRLYVELCASSQFLSEILINNPGMIDDLVDSLVVDRPAAGRGDQGRAGRAVQGGRGPGADPLELPQQGVGSHRHPRHPGPRAGARGDERACRPGRGDRHPGRPRPVGPPRREVRNAGVLCHRQARPLGDPRAGQVRRPGAFLPQRPRSDLRARGGRVDLAAAASSISNEQFVNEVAQRLLSALCWRPIDRPALLRSTRGCARMGRPARSCRRLSALIEYYRQTGQTWERMSLTRARVIFATGGFGERGHRGDPVAADRCRSIEAALAARVLAMRRKLEAARPRHDLKRGPGGLADIEFIVQYLQLLHAASQPDLLRRNMWDALAALRRHRIITPSRVTPTCAEPTSFCARSRAGCGSSITGASRSFRRTAARSSAWPGA